MPIPTIPAFPSRSAGLTQDAYSAGVEASLTATKEAVDAINANASQYNVATSTTSSSSVLIGTGAKTFTVPAGLGFVLGMTLRIANTSSNFMTGEVTSYSSTTLVMNITTIGGSGTFASWSISMAAVGANSATSISNTPAGNISATTVQAAINELDTEKLSSAAGAVTSTNLNTIITGATVGSSTNIPVITYDSTGRITSSTSEIIFPCRAWVNFNGTGVIGANQTIRASGNVSSVFKNATGDYTINFSTAMPDANYAASGMVTYPAVITEATTGPIRSTTQLRFVTANSNTGAPNDFANVSIMFIR